MTPLMKARFTSENVWKSSVTVSFPEQRPNSAILMCFANTILFLPSARWPKLFNGCNRLAITLS